MYWETWSISRSATCWTYSPGRGRSATNSLRGACTASLRSKSIPYTITSSKTAADLGIDNLFAVKANVFLYLKSCAKQFDLIFSDAPYDLEGSEEVIRLVLERDLLKPDGFLVFEHSKNINFFVRPSLFGNQEVTEACNFFFLQKVRKKFGDTDFLYYLSFAISKRCGSSAG